MGRKVARRFKREGTYVYLWLIHVDVWQKPTQYCKAIILQLKINKFLKMFSSLKMQKELQKLKTTKVNNKSKEQSLNGF